MAAVTNTEEMCSFPWDEHSGHSTKNTLWLQNGKIPPWSPAWPHPRCLALDNFVKFSELQLSHLENGKKRVQENGRWTEGRVGSAPCSASEAWPSPDLELSNLSSVLSGGEGQVAQVCEVLSTAPDTVSAQ